MYNSDGASNFEVRLGITRLDTNEQGALMLQSTNGIVHPEYDAVTLANDVAIIELPNGTVITGENCHILINVKLIYLNHESCCLHFLLHKTLSLVSSIQGKILQFFNT